MGLWGRGPRGRVRVKGYRLQGAGRIGLIVRFFKGSISDRLRTTRATTRAHERRLQGSLSKSLQEHYGFVKSAYVERLGLMSVSGLRFGKWGFRVPVRG